MRWIEEDGRVTAFPESFRLQQRQHFRLRRPAIFQRARWPPRREIRTNGTVTAIAERFDGKPLNSPNDLVVHPDGSIWFTDPFYGINGNYEGFQAQHELKEAVYRVDGKNETDREGFRRSGQSEWHLFLTRLQEALCCRHRGTPREIKVWDVDGILLFATENVSCNSTYPDRALQQPQMAFVATWMETSGRERVPAFRLSRRPGNASG